MEGPQRRTKVKEKCQKTLILVFEVIVQPLPKHTFEIGFFRVLAYCAASQWDTRLSCKLDGVLKMNLSLEFANDVF